jgi:NodT family efflux transporter outer membrane factor (OMF) lipoprotein
MIDSFSTREVSPPSKSRVLLTLAVLTLLAGCTVGPDFKAPDPPDVTSLAPPPFADQSLANCKTPGLDLRSLRPTTYCMTPRLAFDLDIPGAWWTLFQSRQLTNVMERALRDNHDLKAAQAALRAAHANYEAQRGAFFPVVNANYMPSKQKVATRDFSAPTWSELPFFTLHTAQLTVSYVPDVFGGTRRLVEVASAQKELQQLLLEATYLTLTSNIALAAIQAESLREQIHYTELAINDESLLKRSELDKSRADTASMDTGISQAAQTLPLLSKQLVAQRDMLTALSGHYAGDGLPVKFDFQEMQLPRILPVSLPSQIVEQRPDVRAAQANLHAATAAVGVAIANRLPLFNLFGNIGTTSSQFKYLFNASPQVLFWTVAGSVTQTIFDGFTLEQRQRAAEAGWNQAAEQYQTAVVTAFQNVADVLQAIERDKESLRLARIAVKFAALNRCLTVAAFVQWDNHNIGIEVKPKASDPRWKDKVERKFEQWWGKNCAPYTGNPPFFSDDDDKSGSDVLTAEQLYLSALLAKAQAKASLYSDVVALFQALGGGWWNRSDIEAPDGQSLLVSTQPN